MDKCGHEYRNILNGGMNSKGKKEILLRLNNQKNHRAGVSLVLEEKLEANIHCPNELKVYKCILPRNLSDSKFFSKVKSSTYKRDVRS